MTTPTPVVPWDYAALEENVDESSSLANTSTNYAPGELLTEPYPG